MSVPTRLRSAAALALLLGGAAAGAPAPAQASAPAPAPASAAAPCPGASGVTVVVDFHELSGGVRQACEPEGGDKTAAKLFPAAGFPLTYVQRFPGMVCQVSGKPADSPCVEAPPTDAYWALWWSDGESGTWAYSSLGVDSLTIPPGGYVAFSWNGSKAKSPPGVDPTPHPPDEPSPTPTKAPTKAPTPTKPPTQSPTPSAEPTTPSAPSTPTESPTPEATPTPEPTKTREPSPSATPSPSDTDDATAAPTDDSTPGDAAPPPGSGGGPDDAGSDSGGLPGWVPPVLVVGLLAAAGGVAYVRRSRAAP